VLPWASQWEGLAPLIALVVLSTWLCRSGYEEPELTFDPLVLARHQACPPHSCALQQMRPTPSHAYS